MINQKNCCCDCHKHIDESECKNLHDEFHKRICNCFFSEFHFHKINCKFHQLINEAIITRPNFKISPPFIDIKNNYVKICCCNHEIKHSEQSKIIFGIPNGDTKNENIIPFKHKEKGKLEKNKNYTVIDYDTTKDFSIIGRAKQMEKIYNIIGNNENSHFIIIYGEREIGKQDFSETACVYLFERKHIY